METVTNLSVINTKTLEGKLLMAAMAKITIESQTDKTPDEVLHQITELADKMYDTEQPQVYPVSYKVDFVTDENKSEFDAFCVKCRQDRNTKDLDTGHLAVLWHFATGRGIYTPAKG